MYYLQSNMSKNVAIEWIEYKKASDISIHIWITECLEIF